MKSNFKKPNCGHHDYFYFLVSMNANECPCSVFSFNTVQIGSPNLVSTIGSGNLVIKGNGQKEKLQQCLQF